MSVICDWLDVTYSPVDTPETAVLAVLQSAGAECLYTDDKGSTWRVIDGVFKVQRAPGFVRLSASGSVLSQLRLQGQFLNYLSALSECPHSVTRLDAALDVLCDAAPILSDLWRRYPRECSLTRKALRTKTIFSTRDDGQQSGTWYAGHRSAAKVTARVYDKTLEALEKRGELLPAITRYELTVRKAMGPTLRDAAEPERVFWHFASPALLQRPEGIAPWDPNWGLGWTYKAESAPAGGVLKSRVEHSAELLALYELSQREGAGGVDYLLSLIRRRMLALSSSEADSEALTPAPVPA